MIFISPFLHDISKSVEFIAFLGKNACVTFFYTFLLRTVSKCCSFTWKNATRSSRYIAGLIFKSFFWSNRPSLTSNFIKLGPGRAQYDSFNLRYELSIFVVQMFISSIFILNKFSNVQNSVLELHVIDMKPLNHPNKLALFLFCQSHSKNFLVKI